MRVLNRSTCGALAALALATFALATPAAAQPCNGVNRGNPHCVSSPALSATPELDSVVLFGSGLVGTLGYAALRLRARRRAD